MQTEIQTAESAATGAELITWDLSDLHPTIGEGQFSADFERITNDADTFAQSWRGRLATLSDDEFLSMLQ
ncbi:MAG: hypothetical protein RML15_09175 [Bacteroidota bacterium]|nr:hypothetical protein [Candidatus Kapabacteria bacterium]MDW8075651.1 hypothetical protein [Bacteroidota bacterium]MDW8272563.1 hypothetical protein [Bacteroidota bacterium]